MGEGYRTLPASLLSEYAIARYGEQLASIQTQLNQVATKEDIANLKVWISGGVIAGVLTGAAIVAGLGQWFMP